MTIRHIRSIMLHSTLAAFVTVGFSVATPLTVSASAASVPSVTVTGDSITYLSGPTVATMIPQASIVGMVGYTSAQLQPYLVQQVATHPDVAIVEEGTNDATHDSSTWRTDLTTAIQTVDAVPCVVWVTVPVFADRGRPVPIATEWNNRLRIAERWHRQRFQIVDYNAAIVASPALTADGLHPTLAGAQWLADQYASAIQRCGSTSQRTV